MASADLPPIKGFVTNTFVDWEGMVACALFLPGCNFRCRFCHARALVLEPDTLPTIPIADVMDYVGKNRNWIDGAVISGGEPVLHSGLEQLILLLKSADVKIKLDTNGSRPDLVADFLKRELLDFVAMDLKAPLDERYAAVCGCSADLAAIRRSIDLLIQGSVGYEFRTTVCPGLHEKRDVVDMARDIAGAASFVLQPFRPIDCIDPAMEGLEPCSRPELQEMAEAAKEFVPNCRVRGEPSDEGRAVLRQA